MTILEMKKEKHKKTGLKNPEIVCFAEHVR